MAYKIKITNDAEGLAWYLNSQVLRFKKAIVHYNQDFPTLPHPDHLQKTVTKWQSWATLLDDLMSKEQ